MPKYWNSQPIHTLIIEALQKKQGVMTDADLYRNLIEVDDTISHTDLNEGLMKLEVDGLVHVYSLTKNKNRVELAKT